MDPLSWTRLVKKPVGALMGGAFAPLANRVLASGEVRRDGGIAQAVGSQQYDPGSQGQAARSSARRSTRSAKCWPCTSAHADDRSAVALADAVQEAAGDSANLAYVDQGYIGERAAKAAFGHSIASEVAKLPEAKRVIVLLPSRWMIQRVFV